MLLDPAYSSPISMKPNSSVCQIQRSGAAKDARSGDGDRLGRIACRLGDHCRYRDGYAESRQIAWIDPPIWIPEGSVIELGPPNRDAIVIGVRLQLGPGDDAVILADVRELDEGDRAAPRG
jgi:hypothetical protein